VSNPVLSYASHDAILAFWNSKTPSIALLTVAPGPDGTGITEPSGGSGYSRQSVTLSSFTRSAGISTTTNTNAIVFGPCVTTDWAQVTYAALIGGDGTLLAYSPLPSPKVCVVGDSFSIGANSVQWRLK
jgi:hypothetical protein